MLAHVNNFELALQVHRFGYLCNLLPLTELTYALLHSLHPPCNDHSPLHEKNLQIRN